MEKPEKPLEIFSALSLMEYIRLMTAACCIQQNKDCVAFTISAENYQKMMAEELHMPLIGLSLQHDSETATLTVTPDAQFLPQYDNKIMREVVSTYYENYKNRYNQWIIIKEE